MTELKPCPSCGGNKVTIEHESQGWLHGCLIGCTNIMCGCSPVISFGLVMPDLIHRDGLKQTLLDLGFYPAIVKSALEKAPTIDAVEVVRCNDCIRRYDTDECPMCYVSGGQYYEYTLENDYCSHGERKGNG